MKYQSKVNRLVTYESSSVGSYKYVTMFFNGKRLLPENKPIKSIKLAISNADGVLSKTAQCKDLKDMLLNAYLAKFINNKR